MHELKFINGRPSDATKLRLDCTACDDLTRFYKDGANVAVCRECEKRHSTDSIVDANAVVS